MTPWLYAGFVGLFGALDLLVSRSQAVRPSPDGTAEKEAARKLANLWGERFSVPPALLMAIWQIESGFNPVAQNMSGGDGRRGGAWGIGQMTLQTARGLDADYPALARQYWPGFHANPDGTSLFNVRENTALSAVLLSLGMMAFGRRPMLAGVSYKMGMRYVAGLLEAGSAIPEDMTLGAQRYWSRLKQAQKCYI